MPQLKKLASFPRGEENEETMPRRATDWSGAENGDTSAAISSAATSETQLEGVAATKISELRGLDGIRTILRETIKPDGSKRVVATIHYEDLTQGTAQGIDEKPPVIEEGVTVLRRNHQMQKMFGSFHHRWRFILTVSLMSLVVAVAAVVTVVVLRRDTTEQGQHNDASFNDQRSQPMSLCQGANCSPNADCIDLGGGLECSCKDGYQGDGVTCTDVDECIGEGSGNNCSIHAMCTNQDGGFECSCKEGFQGDGVMCTGATSSQLPSEPQTEPSAPVPTTAPSAGPSYMPSTKPSVNPTQLPTNTPTIRPTKDPNECAGEGGGDDCSQNADCIDLEGGFECLCKVGYKGDGVTCTDVDECAGEDIAVHNCSMNAACINRDGGFECLCNDGYQGNGESCIDVDECTGDGSGNNCSPNAICKNEDGGFECLCKDGYQGDGKTCTDVDECAGEGIGYNCSVNAECINQDGGYDCSCQRGFFGSPFNDVCKPIVVTLTSPLHGEFLQSASVTVVGQVVGPLGDLSLKVNDESIEIQEDGTVFMPVLLDASVIFNEVKVVATHIPTGFEARDRVVVIVGQSVQLGGRVVESTGIRVTERGLNVLENILKSSVEFSLSDLLPLGQRLISNRCFVDSFFGCLTRGSVIVQSASSVGFSFDLRPSEVTVTVTNIRVDLRIDTNTIDCDLDITANSAIASGTYSLQPDSTDPALVDVGELRDVNVQFSQFDSDLDNACDFINSLLVGVIGDVESLAAGALEVFLGDDTISEIIEEELEQLQVADAILSELGLDASVSFAEIAQDQTGITFVSDAVMSTLIPDGDSPILSHTLLIPQNFPLVHLSSGGVLSPGSVDYDVTLVLCDSVFNQVLAAQVESGSLNIELTEIPIGNTNSIVPISPSILALLLSPAFLQLPSSTALELRIIPTLAPALTGNRGQMGELAEMIIPDLRIEVVSGGSTRHAVISIDMSLAFDFTISGGQIDTDITLQDDAIFRVTLLDNPLGIDEASLQEKVIELSPQLVPLLGGIIPTIELPELFGLKLIAAEISRVENGCIGFYMTVA